MRSSSPNQVTADRVTDKRAHPERALAERALDPGEPRAVLHRAADLAADYLEGAERYSVRPAIAPGEVAAQLPRAPPEQAEDWERILEDYRSLIEPNVTHWNHPGFLGYFANTGSLPGVVGETLTAALNVNAMLWRTAPAATELEERVCDWLRQMFGLPAAFSGHINDTASVSTLIALAAARQRAWPQVRERGLCGGPRLLVYASDQAHSSVDKAAITLGLGTLGVRRIPSDRQFRLDPDALAAAIAEDRADGARPIAVVATAGTTSTTSVDPLAAIARLCQREGVWLHVDAAYGGAAAICPELRPLFAGWEAADSIVMNPHKWLFVPMDCSVLWLRDPDALRTAFAVVPAYLETSESATNLMDLGVQLGRRFRALKLWMVIRRFGVSGLERAIRHHCELARLVESWVAADPDFELAAPVVFSVVCLRARSGGGEAVDGAFQRDLLERINAEGGQLLSLTEVRGRTLLRIAIGNLGTQRRHLEHAWGVMRREAERLRRERGLDVAALSERV